MTVAKNESGVAESTFATSGVTSPAAANTSDTSTPADKVKGKDVSSDKNTPDVDEALTAMESMVMEGRLSSEYEKLCLKVLLKDHDSLKDKITKLKSLLGRSAKAQREAKVEAETAVKRLQDAQKEIERLTEKVEKLATRPTHMDLLADFETNFDRALLSVHHHQAGGESTAAPTVESTIRGGTVVPSEQDSAVLDGLLLQELQDAKQRNEKLEALNAALLHRSSQLENEAKDRRRERDELLNRISHLELEKRMAVMEAEHATRAMEEKAALLAEMEMEIDMVSKASVKAQLRAAKDEELIKSVRTDQRYVHQLEAQVQALQEWATAASQAKTLAQERILLLESQVRSLKKDGSANRQQQQQQVVWEKKGSLVIGAGDVGVRVFECDPHAASMIVTGYNNKQQHHHHRHSSIILRWQFDLTGEDLSIDFSAFQGRCESNDERKKALAANRALIQDRVVKGGAAGDLENAFLFQNACTLLWSNSKSWVRPRTVRFTIQAVALVSEDEAFSLDHDAQDL